MYLAVFGLCVINFIAVKVSALHVVYLTDSCNSSITAPSPLAGLIEPDPRLYYRSDQDCTVILSVASPFRILLQVYRFFLEEPIDGVCIDSLMVYDGAEEDSPALTPDPLCGRVNAFDLETTGSNVTFVFLTDSDGSNSGFGIFYTAFAEAPCTAGLDQFECNNSRCIDSSLICDSYDMCGDGSDETSCEVEGVTDNGLTLPAIIGIVAAAICLMGLVYAGARACFRKHKSKKLMDQLLEEVQRNAKTGNQFTDQDFWGSEKND